MSDVATTCFRAALNPWRFVALLALLCLPTIRPAGAQTAEVPMGATVQGQGSARFVTFRVWAPNASKVAVCGDFNGWKEEPLLRELNRPGHWMLDSRRARPGDAYRYVIDGLPRRDPRARAVNTSENKAYILDPRDFPWGPVDSWKMPPKGDLVMYEMHLGTFASGIPGNASLFERAAKRLSYLKALGINCIQLMPANEFPGERSWGYNPADLFATESSYGGAEA